VHKKPVKKPAAPVATTEPDHRAYRNSPIHAYCPSCGVVESVRAIQQEAPASGIGAGVGAVVGGLLGNQVGNGNGRTLATIAGALGGGYAGNVIEKKRQVTTSYEVIVRMENGNRQRFMMNEQRWMAGDLVYVDNGNLSPR
jgi:outer membrane lipoprotein SlyB